jgi:nucleoid-associated protein YgaU
MFGYSLTTRILVLALLVIGLWALFARSSNASAREAHYQVKAGDTLWSIAATVYRGDPREGVWKLTQANHLAGATISIGQVLRVR